MLNSDKILDNLKAQRQVRMIKRARRKMLLNYLFSKKYKILLVLILLFIMIFPGVVSLYLNWWITSFNIFL